MKIRYGHVTNSSSTSYLIVIDRKTEDSFNTVEEALGFFGCETEDCLEKSYRYVEIDYIKKVIEKGWHFLPCSSGGQGSYNEGNFEFLLKQGGIKMLAEFWCGEDFDLEQSKEYQEAIYED